MIYPHYISLVIRVLVFEKAVGARVSSSRVLIEVALWKSESKLKTRNALTRRERTQIAFLHALCFRSKGSPHRLGSWLAVTRNIEIHRHRKCRDRHWT